MEKLVIKVTVYKEVDPDLYESVSSLPLRRRSAVIRRLWREGLKPQRAREAAATPVEPAAVRSGIANNAAPPSGHERDARDLLRRGLGGLSDLAAFE